uniref:Uncharacterized protein n=1 Tax=Anguilla anguilla TaxID=7936 RepID=A0A0E9RX34_ANGAN
MVWIKWFSHSQIWLTSRRVVFACCNITCIHKF